MDTATIVRQFLSDTFFVDDVADDQSFLRSGAIDSTGMLELVEFLEDRFGIEIDDTDLVPENLDSIERLSAFVARRTTPAVAH